MVNYKARDENDEDVTSLIGGALDLLDQYDLKSNNNYNEKNHGDSNELDLSSEDSDSLKKLGGSFVGGHSDVIKKALKLTPLAFHTIVEHAINHLDSGKHHIGVLQDIIKARSPHHLARMVHNDMKIGGSKIGGAFMNTLKGVTEEAGYQ